MRNGQNKRMRGRNQHHSGHGHGSHNNHGHRKNHNPMSRVYESNGPDVKIRGNPSHIAEKYIQLARDAQSSGDPDFRGKLLPARRALLPADRSGAGTVPPEQSALRPSRHRWRDGLGDDSDEARMRRTAISSRSSAIRRSAPASRSPICRGMRSRFRSSNSRRNSRLMRRASSSRQTTALATSTGCPRSSPAASSRRPSRRPAGAFKAFGQNGHDAQADRFPLHRRRRRHRGPRTEFQGGSARRRSRRQSGRRVALPSAQKCPARAGHFFRELPARRRRQRRLERRHQPASSRAASEPHGRPAWSPRRYARRRTAPRWSPLPAPRRPPSGGTSRARPAARKALRTIRPA